MANRLMWDRACFTSEGEQAKTIGGGDLAIGRYAYRTYGAPRPRTCRNVCHEEILMFSGSLSVINSISLICKMQNCICLELLLACKID